MITRFFSYRLVRFFFLSACQHVHMRKLNKSDGWEETANIAFKNKCITIKKLSSERNSNELVEQQ